MKTDIKFEVYRIVLFFFICFLPLSAMSMWVDDGYAEWRTGYDAVAAPCSFSVDGLSYIINEDGCTVSLVPQYQLCRITLYKHYYYWIDGDGEYDKQDDLPCLTLKKSYYENDFYSYWWTANMGYWHHVEDVGWICDSVGYELCYGWFTRSFDGDIPAYVTNEGNNYAVTAIGDYALASASMNYIGPDDDGYGKDYYYNLNDIRVSIPSTMERIGYVVFDGRYVSEYTCLAPTPPDCSYRWYPFDEDGLNGNEFLYVPGYALELYLKPDEYTYGDYYEFYDDKPYEPYVCWAGFYSNKVRGIYDYDFEVDGLYYKIYGNEVAVAHGPNTISDCYQAVIPDSVYYEGIFYPVTAIDDNAFRNCINLTSLTIPVTITRVGNDILTGSHPRTIYINGTGEWNAGPLCVTVNTLFVGSGVTGIKGLQVDPAKIFTFASTPPVCDQNTFLSYRGTLHVPGASLAAYFTAPYWCNFINSLGDAIEPKIVTLDKTSATVIVNNSVNLIASVLPRNASYNTVSWLSTNSSIAIVDNGNVVCKSIGECEIVALCGDSQATCHLSVIEPIALSFDNDSIALEYTDQVTLTVICQPNDAIYQNIIWNSSDSTVAMVDNGLVTAVGIGECEITATCGNMVAVCHVTVISPTIVLSKDMIVLELSQQDALSAQVYPENDAYQILSWTSTNENVATYANGVVTAVGVGECDIVATCFNVTAKCHVIVVETMIQISLNKHQVSVLPNHIITVTPSSYPVSTSFVVSSSNPSVAAARMANGKVQIVGVSEGLATITVAAADGMAIPDTCLVTVYTQLGDVNGDGFVDVNDVTETIDYVLSDNNSLSNANNADVDRNGAVDVSDVTLLINYVLGNINDFYETTTVTVNGVSFKMVHVSGGSFMMGGTDEQGSDVYDNEFPVHNVTLSDFSIGQTEVTQALWEAVMGSNPSAFTGDLNRPVEKVSWNDCQNFINKLNELTGKSFRLPTEAEYEFAARGGNLSKGYKFAGSNDINDVAWYSGNAGSITHPVGTKTPNELGIYDMNGNVWEWCQDWYGSYAGDDQTNPSGAASGTAKVTRGGGWGGGPRDCRIAIRGSSNPAITGRSLGLRLAL